MGKNILVQRRGRGFFIFRAPTHRRLHPTGYNSVNGHSTGFVRDLLHEVARGAPLARLVVGSNGDVYIPAPEGMRSEEHTSELQSRGHLVCRLLLEKKK